MRRDGWRCHYCGADSNLTINHKVPRVNGGTDAEDNLLTACKTCNRLKGDNSYDEFMAYLEERQG